MSKSMRSEFADIRNTKFWKEFIADIEAQREGYLSSLKNNAHISDTISVGQLWQKMYQGLSLILAYPGRLTGDTDSGTPSSADPATY